jgi:hypothetical protein
MQAEHFEPSDRANRTSLQGRMNADYYDLVEVFGEPHATHGDKTLAEWCFEFKDDTVFTIYDWKNYGGQVEYVESWHIGGHGGGLLLVDRVETLIKNIMGVNTPSSSATE